MELEYNKKDLTKSAKTKTVVKNVLPEGWEMYCARGTWKVRDDKGVLLHFASEEAAWVHING
jgi:hypothetical protein|tara:strand:+ start:197 stop:382 length:186 start_codon:yes stop_codon:yes gene_type:complete